jgi:hypothetical protein
METLRSANEQKIFEIQRINGQLNKALEVILKRLNKYLFVGVSFRQLNKQWI